MTSKTKLVGAFVALVVISPVALLIHWDLHSFYGSLDSKRRLAVSIERGREIVKALEEFEQRNGRLPSSLEELVPTFVPAIRPPLVGNSGWIYQTIPAGRFLLEFSESSGYPSCWYSTAQKEWHADF